MISIHAPHAGRDVKGLDNMAENLHFNPRAPCGARRPRGVRIIGKLFISIHAPHAGRDTPKEDNNQNGEISIHAPHAGRDDAFA